MNQKAQQRNEAGLVFRAASARSIPGSLFRTFGRQRRAEMNGISKSHERSGDHMAIYSGQHDTASDLEISLIIPAYNEELYLPTLLASVKKARCHCSSRLDWLEVIVADNGSTDGTADIARRHGCRVVDVPQRSIGAARNAGAAVARGRVLCFVDADTRLHPRTFLEISEALQRSDVIGGATGVRPARWSPPLRLLSLLSLPARMMGMDWGLVFCRRSAFEGVCGYRDDLLAGEDIDFLMRLRQFARVQRAFLLRLPGVKTIASTRRFDKHGHWRFLAIIAQIGFWRLISPRRFKEQVWRYWYEER